MQPVSIWITAGEASGDRFGGMLAAHLKSSLRDCRISAIGSRHLREVAHCMLEDSSDWGAIGIVRSVANLPKVSAAYVRLLGRARKETPVLHVPVDFGAFNIPLARKLRALGSKVLYYMPPGSWRKDRQGHDLPRVADMIATPFRWSADALRKAGANAVFVGHPILDIAPTVSAEERENLVALLPGSRKHEVRANMPALSKACRVLVSTDPNLSFGLALAPGIDDDSVLAIWRRAMKQPLEIVRDNAMSLLVRARVGLVCSGTATLEAAVCFCPMVVVYRGDWLMQVEWRLRRPKFDFIALPSIVAGRRLCPELIQSQATPERIASETLKLLRGPDREDQIRGFEEVVSALGERGATERTATLAMSLVSAGHPSSCP